MRQIDLNADVGESFGIYRLGEDASLLRCISSASVACGVHAGDPSVIRVTVQLAAESGVSLGAHPGYPDREGFGRREMSLSRVELEDSVMYQVAAVMGMASGLGVTLRHVKPHGALYHAVTHDIPRAEAVVSAITRLNPALRVFAPANTALARVAEQAGLRVVREAFVDRQYEVDGSLTPRAVPGAVLQDGDAVVARAVELAATGTLRCRTGELLEIPAETLCIHGDTPGATSLACSLRAALGAAGIAVRPPD